LIEKYESDLLDKMESDKLWKYADYCLTNVLNVQLR
jgi:hypothetical protein